MKWKGVTYLPVTNHRHMYLFIYAVVQELEERDEAERRSEESVHHDVGVPAVVAHLINTAKWSHKQLLERRY